MCCEQVLYFDVQHERAESDARTRRHRCSPADPCVYSKVDSRVSRHAVRSRCAPLVPDCKQMEVHALIRLAYHTLVIAPFIEIDMR